LIAENYGIRHFKSSDKSPRTQLSSGTLQTSQLKMLSWNNLIKNKKERLLRKWKWCSKDRRLSNRRPDMEEVQGLSQQQIRVNLSLDNLSKEGIRGQAPPRESEEDQLPQAVKHRKEELSQILISRCSS